MTRPPRIKAYSALEEAEIRDFAEGIRSAYPKIVLEVERMSTTALVNRLLQENADPQWDMIFGIALSAVRGSEIERNLAVVPELDGLPAARGRWYCPSGFVPVFCVNAERLARLGLPCPHSWADLASGEFASEIVIPDPNSSGAGFLHLAALIESEGDRAWSILGNVLRQNPLIVRSTGETCQSVLDSERAIAVTVSTAAAHAIRRSSVLQTMIPEDAKRYEPEAFGVNVASELKSPCFLIARWMHSPAAREIVKSCQKYSWSDFSSCGSLLVQLDVDAASHSRTLWLSNWREAVVRHASNALMGVAGKVDGKMADFPGVLLRQAPGGMTPL